MPKHKNKQRRNNWNSGFQQNNWRNPEYTYQNDQVNMGQNYYNNSYYEPSFQHNVAQNYSNNFYDQRFQDNMTQNNYNSNFNSNVSNGNFSPNYPRNFTQNDQQDNFSQNFPGNFTQIGQQTIRHSNRNNKVQRCTMKNKSNNFTKERNASISSDLNRSFQGNNVINNINDIETDITGNCIQQKPCNTEHQPLNSRKLSKETKLKARIDSYAIKTQLYNEKGYIIKESLYKNPDLFQDLSEDNNEETNSNETNVEWTCTFWKKHNGSSIPDNSRPSQNIGKVSKKNQNRLEKSLNKMLAKPAELSKGMSLLQKMGWTGGGLGRDGDGIVEPIAPRATYAVKTIGLGHLTEKAEKPKKHKPFSQVNKHQLKSAEFQNNFCLNLLLYVLQFVKNDEQNKMVFEPRLTKMERKRIHEFIGKLRECSDLDEFDDRHLTPKHFALIKDIWVHNCYELWTESEGEGQDRRLCLYKEAPAHVYLVTPEDLTLNDENEANDDSDDNNVQDDEKLHRAHVKDETQSRNEEDRKDAEEETCILPKIKTENDENINMCDEIDNKIEMTEQKSESECVTDEKENKLMNDTNINLCDEIDRKMEINDQVTETNDQNSIVKEIKLETQEDMKETLSNEKDTNTLRKIKLESDKNVNFVKGTDFNEKAIGKIKSENDKEMDIDEKSIKNDGNATILGKIVKYFKEFLEEAVFKEFRFLGPFSDEELININLFFDICMELDDGQSEEKDELLKLFGDGSLEVLEDNNGKRFIHKKEENQESPKREEVSSECVICLD